MSDNIELYDNPRIRRMVWNSVGQKSTREISEETGLRPEQVIALKKELYDEVDDVSVAQLRMKLLRDFQEMATELREDYKNAETEYKAGIMNAATSAMDKVMKELARASKAEETAMERLNTLRIREIMTLMDKVVTSGVRRVSEEHGLDELEILAVFNEALVDAAREMDN